MPGPARPSSTRFRRALLLLGVGVGVLALGACSDPPTPTRAQLEQAFRTSGFSARSATCITNRLFAILTPEQLEAVAENGPSRIPAEKSTDLSTGIARCNDGTPADGANTTTTSAPTSSTTTTTPANQPTTSGGVATNGAGAGGADASSTTAPSSTTP